MHEGHIHEHEHSAGETGSPAEAEALLRYTLQHNRSHENELHELAHTLESLGLDAAALEVHRSLDDARCATEHIERAIAALDGAADKK
ncbi:MAG: hypothetical protein LBS90_05355 [Oscillospiraceae bacterium]|jgi:hypothetical protein|nr:hypothetical protein [Oscillospiraceae bacterium]